MRIAFDAKRLFNNHTGLGNYCRTLLDNLHRFYPQNDYLLYTPKITHQKFREKYTQRHQIFIPQTKFKHIWRSYAIRKDLERDKIDFYHGLSNEIPFWLKNIKTVVTIHDVIFKVLPHTYPSIDRWLYEEKTKYACKHADQIIAISECTKQDLIRFFDVEAERIKVIYQPCQPIFYADESTLEKVIYSPDSLNLIASLPSEYILYVGAIIERKNLLTLVKAVQQIPDNQRIPLVVIGEGKTYKKEIQEYIKRHYLEKWVYWLTNITTIDVLKQLYQKAQLFVYPSFYEGFGLPIVEAMLCGTPVITSNVAAMPEAGGKFAKLIHPNNTNELSGAIIELVNDTKLRKELGRKGQMDALKRFDPELLTKKVMDIYLQV